MPERRRTKNGDRDSDDRDVIQVLRWSRTLEEKINLIFLIQKMLLMSVSDPRPRWTFTVQSCSLPPTKEKTKKWSARCSDFEASKSHRTFEVLDHHEMTSFVLSRSTPSLMGVCHFLFPRHFASSMPSIPSRPWPLGLWPHLSIPCPCLLRLVRQNLFGRRCRPKSWRLERFRHRRDRSSLRLDCFERLVMYRLSRLEVLCGFHKGF